MQKWIMATLAAVACVFGFVLLMVNVANTEKKEEVAKGPSMPAVTLDVAAAEAIYKANCIACHGDQLEGKMGPNLQKVGSKMSAEKLYKLVLDGKGGMPSFKNSLKEEEVANLALWLADHK